MTDASAGLPNWRGLSVLVVSPTPTHPQDHGNRKRIFEICSELKRQGAQIHFIYYAAEQDWRDRRPTRWEREMAAAWDNFHLVLPSRPLHESAKGDDHLIDEWQDAALAGCVRWYCSVRKYDAVIVNYTWLSFCFDHVPPGTFKILDTHDVFSDRRAMLEKHGISAEFFHTTRKEEAKAIARAHMVWAIKPSEREFFEHQLGAKLSLTMLHAEPDKNWWSGAASKDGWLRAGVIGARNNVNRRNLEMFLEEALPIFEDYIAPVKIVIAGSCADDFMGINDPNIEIMGRVAEVEDFYRNVDVIIAPMQFSTGLKIKVSEALASGAPLIAHEHATEGYPVTDPMHRLASFEAIARELAILSFDHSRLSAMAVASRAVSADIQRDVLGAIEQTRRALIDFLKPAVCVVMPLCALDRQSPLHDRFLAASDYLRAAKSIAIYLTGEAGKFDPEVLRFPGAAPVVFVAPDLARQLGETLPETWISAAFADVLQSREIGSAYFLAAVPELSPHDCAGLKQASISQDAVEISGDDFSQLADMLRSVTEVVLVSALSATQNASDTRRPSYGRNRLHANFARRRKPKPENAGLLVLGDENDPLVPVLQDLATRLGFSAAVLDPADPGEAERLAAFQNPAAADAANTERVRLIVDLTQDRLLLATMQGDIPIIKGPRGMAGVIRHNESGDIRPVTLGGFLHCVARGLVDEGYRQQICEKMSGDAGREHSVVRGAQASRFNPDNANSRSAAEHLFQ